MRRGLLRGNGQRNGGSEPVRRWIILRAGRHNGCGVPRGLLLPPGLWRAHALRFRLFQQLGRGKLLGLCRWQLPCPWQLNARF